MSRNRSIYWLLFLGASMVFCSCVSIHAQDSTVQPESRHILILNKTHETLKEINIGDPIRLKLLDATKVKGHITSIDSTFFTVDNIVVYIDQIKKISTKKVWVQGVGVVLLAGAVASFSSFDPCYLASPCSENPEVLFFGLGLTGVAVAAILPEYQKIGQSKRFIVISNKPELVESQ